MKNIGRLRRHKRSRRKLKGEESKPRLTIFRSKKHMYAQLINDDEHKTILNFSTTTKEFQAMSIKCSDQAGAKEVGKIIAARSIEKGVKEITFDRSGYRYHGRIKALADGAREGGLKF